MQLLYALAKLRTPFLDTVLGALTNCGGEIVFMAVAIIVFWCVSKSCGYYMLTVGFVGTIVNQFLKLVFRIPRPWVKNPNFQIVESARAEATGYSFPSGHTQNVFASFGCLGRWTKRTWLRVVCAAVIVLTAFSRMYLGVHTPLDVGVSFGLGLVLVFALYPLFRDIDSHRTGSTGFSASWPCWALRICSLPSSGHFPRMWTPPTSPPAARTPTRCSARCWA